MEKINFLLTQVEGKNIVFDGESLSIFEISNQMVPFFQASEILDNKTKESFEEEIEYLQNQGYLRKLKSLDGKKVNTKNYYLSIQNTLECPLNCSYCFSKKIKCLPRKMTKETSIEIVDFFRKGIGKDANNFEIYFTSGGEPLTNFEVIKEVYNYCNNLDDLIKYDIGFTTNGVLINEKVLDFIEKTDIRVAMSIDGDIEKHDKNRKYIDGRGSYKDTMKASRMIINAMNSPERKLYVFSVIMPEDNDYVSRLKYMVDSGFEKVQMKVVRDCDNTNKILNKENIENIKVNYTKLVDFLKEEILNNRWKYVMALLDYNNFLGQAMIRIISGKKALYRCEAGKTKFSILPNGDIYPCDFYSMYPETKMGNIKSGFIDDSVVDKWYEKTCDSYEVCSTCWAKYICGGSCYFSRYINNGKQNELVCEINKHIITLVIQMVSSLKINNNAIFKRLEKVVESIISYR